MMSSQEVSVSYLTSSFKGRGVAYCDVGHAPLLATSETVFQHDTLNSGAKEYDIKLKPLLSAFHLRPFALRSMRCFLMFYLPLLQSNIEECANVSLHDLVDEHQDVDYVLPLKITVKQILLETSVVTTRRVLERLAVHHLSQRAAWKLIKDVPMSAMHKANRGMPFYIYFVRVSRTTFRGQFLGYAASWIVQVGIECYRFVRDISKSNEVDDVTVDPQHKERVKLLGDRVYYVTVRCCSSLISASIGSGISATLLRPSSGQSVEISLLMDLMKKKSSVNGQTIHSTGLYSVTIAATSAAIYAAASAPFASGSLYGFNVTRVAYCDAVATTSLLRDASENVFRQDTKEYCNTLKNGSQRKYFGDIYTAGVERGVMIGGGGEGRFWVGGGGGEVVWGKRGVGAGVENSLERKRTGMIVELSRGLLRHGVDNLEDESGRGPGGEWGGWVGGRGFLESSGITVEARGVGGGFSRGWG
ncbi:hypothetical protein Tco_0701738 [Tanacetum coccineum]